MYGMVRTFFGDHPDNLIEKEVVAAVANRGGAGGPTFSAPDLGKCPKCGQDMAFGCATGCDYNPKHNIYCKRLDPDAWIPTKSNPDDAGFDIRSIETCTVPAGHSLLISTGLSLEVPEGFYTRIAPRSGLALNKGIDVHAGVVDRGYTGEI